MKQNPKPQEFTGVASIVTRYHGPTNTRGSRISARRGDHRPGDKVAWVSYNHEFSGVACHAEAALKLLEIGGLDWTLCPIAGYIHTGYVFCVAPD